mgnify:FL=1
MNRTFQVAIAAVTGGLLLTASSAEACRTSRPVVVFDQKPKAELAEGMQQIKIKIGKFNNRKSLPGPPTSFAAKILNGRNPAGEEILIGVPKTGFCDFVAQAGKSQIAWVTGIFIKYSDGTDLYVNGQRVFEAKGHF